MKKLSVLLALLLVLSLSLTGCDLLSALGLGNSAPISLDDVPAYAGKAYVEINGGVPSFDEEDKAGATKSYEFYSPHDALGRCGYAEASVGVDIMPTEERGSIGSVKPSGWHTVKYDIVDGKYLYNRCHLIGFQLSGENANERNLITGTRYMNVEGMLPFENMVADYIKETGNHVLYRVTPIFKGDELVARGVQMEALSVEDEGEGICFNVYCYNNQPGVKLNYATGDSEAYDNDPALDYGKENEGARCDYVLNTNSKKIHLPSCSSVDDMNPENRKDYTGTKEELLNQGYSECGFCKP